MGKGIVEGRSFFRFVKDVAMRECRILYHSPIYWLCMIVLPLTVLIFFTTMMNEGQPTRLPIAIVDNDHSVLSRTLIRRLDAFQSTEIVAQYDNVNEASKAMREGDIYAFLHIPYGMAAQLSTGRQPHMSYYYTMTTITGGTLAMKDLKTISLLATGAAGKQVMSAKGMSDKQIATFLQPIEVDLHQINNPWTNYNMYLSCVFVPGLFMLFIFLITAYSLGCELKFNRSRQWIASAGNNIWLALIGKLLPHTMILVTVASIYVWHLFGYMGFVHHGGAMAMVLLSLAMVLPAQGFGVAIFGLIPSMRMSMSVCSLWAVLSFSMVGSAFPIEAMDSPIQALSWLFPLRHYFMIYQSQILNGYALSGVWVHVLCLLAFTLLPILVVSRIKRVMLIYEYTK